MLQKFFAFLSWLFLVTLVAVFCHSCANIAAPTGGLYDVDPPVVKKSTPAFNSLNANPKKIEIEFNENIKIEKSNEKVIITPPQKNMPVIRSAGRVAIVELKDTLLANTTYTIDFTDAIVDNNEGNPLENFVYSFSTGDRLDTLSIAGRVLTADNLEPVTGMFVGIHSNHHDTAFTRIPFERISRTDSRGKFIVRGMAPGSYRVFALNDLNRDYKYDNPLENVAFLDSIVIPSTMPAVRQDTVFQDSLTIDTIKTVHYTRFLPDNLVLRSFLSDFQRQYLQKLERNEPHKLTLLFAAPTEKPTFFLLNPDRRDDDWYVAERSAKNDTLTLWVTDSLIYQQDSIRMQINYIRTDSLNQNFIATDTVGFNIRRTARDRGNKEKEKEKEKKDKEKEGDEEIPITFLNVQTNIQSTFELYNPIRIEFEQPVIAFDSTYVQLLIGVDSLFEPVPFRVEADSLNPRKFALRPRWVPDGKYKMIIDSAAITSHYGLWNNKYEQSFTVKKLDQYGNLELSLSGLPESEQVFVELLDKSDKPFRKSFVKGNKARFQDLPPGEVYLRLVIDENGDGVWTTGNYEKGRQPEQVFYFPGKLPIRANGYLDQPWDIHSTPVIEQKPLEITTNKPQEKKRRDPNREREEQQRQNQQGSSSSRRGSSNSAPGSSLGTPADMR
ncbi:Ig-like domain-containing protein [Proteiniphilum sp.]|uniref:Ig-like domain-containing protein n=1 Tax=Proteiniphilum sp. TaxID=1926877 RepID=UPI002B1EE64E|nr:Ig-like domain-containing protein [Proteiniphilum sp.]MEA4916782.1 Ig-like domain-containing protein [Proteiniphilum sp.]